MAAALSAAAAERNQPLVDVFSDRARDGHEFGWFVTGVMVKAGLVGVSASVLLGLQVRATGTATVLADLAKGRYGASDAEITAVARCGIISPCLINMSHSYIPEE